MFPLKRCTCCGGSGYEGPSGAQLINGILDACNSDYFTVAELKADPRLQALLASYNPKQLGKALLAIEGMRIDDLVLERVGKERNRTARWRIRSLSV